MIDDIAQVEIDRHIRTLQEIVREEGDTLHEIYSEDIEKTPDCPDDDTLKLFFEYKLSQRQTEDLYEHISGCSSCLKATQAYLREEGF